MKVNEIDAVQYGIGSLVVVEETVRDEQRACSGFQGKALESIVPRLRQEPACMH